MITTIIPVGPNPRHQTYLPEAVHSVLKQTEPGPILLIDDMADLRPEDWPDCTIWRSPWRVGPAAAWNFGVSLATTEYSLLMGSDDWLEPQCLAQCEQAIHKAHDPLGYYSLTIRYHNPEGIAAPGAAPHGTIQDLPCNAAVVSKQLWRHTGGFSPEMGLGSMDAAFISVLIGHDGEAGRIRHIAKGVPLYNVRVHNGQEGRTYAPYYGAIIAVRNALTMLWQRPHWRRYEP